MGADQGVSTIGTSMRVFYSQNGGFEISRVVRSIPESVRTPLKPRARQVPDFVRRRLIRSTRSSMRKRSRGGRIKSKNEL